MKEAFEKKQTQIYLRPVRGSSVVSARAPSGFQYELNRHYVTCVHSTLFGVKIGKIILFSKETGFPELSSLIALSQ